MPVEPVPCTPDGGGTPGACKCSPSIATSPLCRADGSTVLLVVRSPCTACDDPGTGTDRTMEYRLGLTDGAGRELVFLGRKRLTARAPSGLWRETTTLPFRLSPRDDAHGTAATGTLRPRPLDFARQLASFRASGPGGPAAVGQFGRFFLGRLRHIYL